MLQMSLFEDELEKEFKKAIVEALKSGSGFAGSKERIKAMYKKDITKSERIKLLKNEYGIGGCCYVNGITQHHDAKGITIKLNTGESKHYNWSKIHDLISLLISNRQYE